MPSQFVTFKIDLDVWERFKRKFSRDKVRYYKKAKQQLKLRTNELIARLLKKYLTGEMQIDTTTPLPTNDCVMRGVSLDSDVWAEATKHLVDLKIEGNGSSLGELISRVIVCYNSQEGEECLNF